MNNYSRSDRVAHLIHREIAWIIENELRDTRVNMITVTDVTVSKDLKNAKIFVSVLGGDEDIKQSMLVLKSATKFIRGLLAEKMSLRYLPELTFIYDSSTIDGMKMDKILASLKTHDE